jgi:Cell division protein CrgA
LHRSGATTQALTLLVVGRATGVTPCRLLITVREIWLLAGRAGRMHSREQLRLPAEARAPAPHPALARAQGGETDQETTVPKSRVRSKAVYTPPPRSAKAQVSPRWLVPTMLGCLLLGLIWISLFYVTSGSNPLQSALGSWNLVVGFVFIIAGVSLATKWR